MTKKYYCLILYIIALIGLKTDKIFCQQTAQSEFTNFTIDTILTDRISIRALMPDNDLLWYAADKGRYGFINLQTKEKTEFHIKTDSIISDFRSMVQTSKYIFLLNTGNPALLYRISKDGTERKLIYTETHEKVFYDSMQFRNDNEGIAVGDPLSDCFSIIITRDGGDSWQKISCKNLPKTVEGEAAFAASNTNIVIKGNKTWIVSGGKKARVFYSFDNWKTWNVAESPIIQGEAMTGIFTSDFYDENIGFIAGGNYDVPNRNHHNKAFTTDGGKTWKSVGENYAFGYASCVQYIPNSNAQQLVTVGAFGLQYTSDAGETWSQISDDRDLYSIRFGNESTAFAAGKNKIIRIQFKP